MTLPLLSRTQFRTVIGIVGDVKQDNLADAAPPTVYWYSRDRDWAGMMLAVRTAGDPTSVAAAATAVVRGLDAEQPVQNIRTMVEIRDELLTSQRLSALLLASFAVVALTLASVGIYSVLSYIVRGRSREIGIRAALGAQAGDVLRLVVLEGMTPALIGIAVGAVAALAASLRPRAPRLRRQRVGSADAGRRRRDAGPDRAAGQRHPGLAGQPPQSAVHLARLRRVRGTPISSGSAAGRRPAVSGGAAGRAGSGVGCLDDDGHDDRIVGVVVGRVPGVGFDLMDRDVVGRRRPLEVVRRTGVGRGGCG